MKTHSRPGFAKSLYAGVAVAGLALSATAHAQEQAAEQDSVSKMETVIVTAQKRAENVQNVPLSITAVSGATLESLHITQPRQLTQIDPSVGFRQSLSSRTSGLMIRGIGTISFSAGIEQSISTVVDGVVLADPSSISTLSDIERVEILRGPQGMLFGKNASAGLVHFVTKRPVIGENEGRVRIDIGNRGERNAELIGNVAIGETAALRVILNHNQADGLIRNVAQGGDDTDPRDITAVTAKFLWEPTDRFTLYVSADRAESDAFCCSSTWRAVAPGYAPAIVNQQYGIVAGPDNLKVAANGRFYGESLSQGISVQADYDVGDYTITSISAYRQANRSAFYDGDLTTVSYIDQNGGGGETDWFTQELRLTSPIGDRFDYVLGAYYYSSTTDSDITQRGELSWIFPHTAGQVVGVVPGAPAGTIFQTTTNNTVESKSIAVFGQGTLHLTDKFDIILGLRGTKDEVDLEYSRQPTPGTVFIPGSVAMRYDQSLSNENLSWRLGGRYNLSDDIMLFASASRGYKGPGFSGLGATVQGADQRVRAEIPTSYELGVKSTILDNRLLLNASVYSTEVKDFQAQVADLSSATYSTRITNAGSIRTQGAEFNLVGRLSPDLRLNFGGAYNHGRYLDFNGVQCYFGQPKVSAGGPCVAPPASPNSPDGVFNAAGKSLAGVPTWTLGSTLSYDRDLENGLHFFSQANWNWQSDVNYAANGDPGAVQKAFSLIGGRIGVRDRDDRWSLSVYGTNLLDERWAAQITASPVTALNPGGYVQYFSPDSVRRVGISFETRF